MTLSTDSVQESNVIMVTDPEEVKSPNVGENLDSQSTCSRVALLKDLYSRKSCVGDSIISTVGTLLESSGPMVGRTLPTARSAAVMEKLSLSLTVLIDYAVLFGFRKKAFNTESTLTHWQLCSVKCGWVKFLKYKLAAFMSSHLECTLPAKPFACDDVPSQLAGGTLGRFIRLIMKSNRALSFAVGILYSKKGMPRPDKAAQNRAKLETFEVLTTTHPPKHSELASIDTITFEIRRTVAEIFGHHRILPSDLKIPYAPSIKANYTSARSEFGTFGVLFEDKILTDHVPQNYMRSFYGNALVKVSDDEIEDEDKVFYKVKPEFRSSVTEIYSEAYDKAFCCAKEEEALVSLVTLPEALKNRTISKGPPFTYFVLRPVQKFLHKIMRKLRPFMLLGEPFPTPAQLKKVFDKVPGLFHSLDYTSATDLLNPDLSRYCMNIICDAVGLSDDYRELCIKALVGHLIEHPITEEPVPQVWGQLMGSIMSFIILCIINLAVIRLALEISEKRSYTLDNIPALVNGDDGLVRGSDQFSPVWEEVAAVAGLIPSLGKTYSHASFCNINSTSFELSPSGEFIHIPYVNMGLVNGMTRSGTGGYQTDAVDTTDPFVFTIGQSHHALLRSCPRDLRLKVHNQFLRKNSKLLKNLHIPWYIPESLGGVGLMPLVIYGGGDDFDEIVRSYMVTKTGHVCGPSRSDVMIAMSIFDGHNRSFAVGKVPSAQPIQARPIWHKGFREYNSGHQHIQVVETDESFMDLSTYFLTPSSVMVKLSESARDEKYKRNVRAWVSLSKLMEETNSFRGDELFLDL